MKAMANHSQASRAGRAYLGFAKDVAVEDHLIPSGSVHTIGSPKPIPLSFFARSRFIGSSITMSLSSLADISFAVSS